MKVELLPSVIEMTNYCEDKGYEIFPLAKNKIVTVMIFFKDKLIKQGNIKYKIDNWQKESYTKLYKAIAFK